METCQVCSCLLLTQVHNDHQIVAYLSWCGSESEYCGSVKVTPTSVLWLCAALLAAFTFLDK